MSNLRERTAVRVARGDGSRLGGASGAVGRGESGEVRSPTHLVDDVRLGALVNAAD